MCGVNTKEDFQTLDGPYISERRKYTSIGLTMFTMTCLTLFSFSYAFFQIFYSNLQAFEWRSALPWVFCYVLATIATLIFLNLQRFVLTISNSVLIRLDGGVKRLASGLVGILLSAMISIVVGVPLQTLILSPSIEASINANRFSYDIKVDDYVKSRSNDIVNMIIRWDELGRNSEKKSKLINEFPDLNSECEHDLYICYQSLKVKLSSLGANIENVKTLPLTEQIKLQYDNEITLIQFVKVQEKLKMSQTTGFLYRSNVGFESEPFFSWLIILSVMFLQATPGIARMLSHPSVYDYAQIEIDRLSIANHGIELEADYVFDEFGNKIPVDRFHEAEGIYKEVMSKVDHHSFEMKQEMENIKNKTFNDISSYNYPYDRSKSN